MSHRPGIRRREWALALASACMAPALAWATEAKARWLVDGRPGAQARAAVALLAAADTHGLDPRDYDAPALARALDAADAAGGAGVSAAEPGGAGASAAAWRLEVALSRAVERYLADLAFGRVDPRQLHHRFSVAPRAGFDPAAALDAALARGRLADAVEAAVPPLPLYGRLQAALARYRWMARDAAGAWARPWPAWPGADRRRPGKLAPGQSWAGLGLLAERLTWLGDLDAGAPRPPRYEGALVEAVRAFQQRHGLAVDGVVGAATRAALDVPPAARTRQIALTMERLRWTPLMHGRRMVVVNIPEFVLRAYEVIDGRIVMRHTMRVIVGEALDKQTPLFDERMRSIEFSPYWNIPPSIARDETVPRLKRDPGYWDRQGFEFVGARGVDTALTSDKLAAVLAGQLRIRQRPGPRNALGDIKFVFPNSSHIFLHHTPGVALFERDRRDFSHGCIRVEDPVALARFVMDGMPGWDDARIREAMARGTSTTVPLAEPLPVLIAYGTVLVKNGRIHFYDDVYRLDAQLQAALDARTASVPTPADHRTR